MSNRGGKLAHSCDAVRVRQLHLCLAKLPLALAGFGLGPLALGQIEHETDTLVPTFFEVRGADEHGHAAAVPPEVLLLVRLRGSGHLQFFNGPFVMVAPFGRRQVRPAKATRDEVLTVVPHDTEECIISLENPTFEIPDVDPNDVRIDQAPDLRLPVLKTAVET